MMQNINNVSNRKRPRITAGDIYMVRDEHGVDVGYCVISQATRGSIQIGYFFDPSVTHLKDLISKKDKVYLEAVCVLWFGYVGIRDGEWPLIGKIEPFKIGDWPMAVGVWRELDRLPYFACFFNSKSLTLSHKVPIRNTSFEDGEIVLISYSLDGYLSAAYQLRNLIPLGRRALLECGC